MLPRHPSPSQEHKKTMNDRISLLNDPDRYSAKLPIWEGRLRLWHWTNLLVITLLILSYLIFDNHKLLGLPKPQTVFFQKTHVILGYLFVAFLLLRLHLASKGAPFSRWKDLDPRHEGKGFVTVLREEVALHMRPATDASGLPVPDPDPGHNRLGRYLYLPLLAVILPLQAITGLLWASLKFGWLPLPSLHTLSRPAFAATKWVVSNIHAAILYAILGFIALHLLGLVKYELTFASDLFSSMIHGKKILTKKAVENYRKELDSQKK
jgi:Ni/Fe-hydrogenase 1 B-type cytochrome subunit